MTNPSSTTATTVTTAPNPATNTNTTTTTTTTVNTTTTTTTVNTSKSFSSSSSSAAASSSSPSKLNPSQTKNSTSQHPIHLPPPPQQQFHHHHHHHPHSAIKNNHFHSSPPQAQAQVQATYPHHHHSQNRHQSSRSTSSISSRSSISSKTSSFIIPSSSQPNSHPNSNHPYQLSFDQIHCPNLEIEQLQSDSPILNPSFTSIHPRLNNLPPPSSTPIETTTTATTTPNTSLHAAYVLLAEFDIDTGSGLKHQYPSPTGTAEHVLADLMLPDGAHDRNEDWTVFFLNQTPRLTVNRRSHSPAGCPSSSSSASSSSSSSSSPSNKPTQSKQGPSRSSLDASSSSNPSSQPKPDRQLLYVISLVRTKKDNSVRRGAICKAMAVCSYYPYIQIFKPILLLALEDYFANPSIDCLARLFHAVNTMDTRGLPRLSYHERLILRCSERQDMFEEKFMVPTPESVEGLGSQNNLSLPSSSIIPPFHSFSVSNTPSGLTKPSSIDSTPDTPLLASSSSYISLDSRSIYSSHNSHPHQRTESGSYSNASSNDSPRGGHPADQQLFKSHGRTTSHLGNLSHLQSHPSNSNLSTHSFSHHQAHPPPTHKRPRDTHFFDTKIEYGGKAIPVRIPLQTFPGEVGEYSLIKLIQTFSSPNALNPNGPLHPHLHSSGPFTHPIILLFNALVTQKRIVFLGHGLPAGHVSEIVLAACALGSGCGGVLEGFISRAFPYCNLTIYDDFKVIPGYIAGVTNPIFEHHTDAWDVFCNIETGKITVSKDISMPTPSARPFSPAPPERSTTELTISSGAVIAGMMTAKDEILKSTTGGIGNSINASSSALASTNLKMETAKDSSDNVLMEDILQAIQAHFGEPIIRARFIDYVRRFIRISSRWEEDQFGTSSIGIKTSAFRPHPSLFNPTKTPSSSNARNHSHHLPSHLDRTQSSSSSSSSSSSASLIDRINSLGSGVVFVDDEPAYKKEIALNSARVEGWRESDSYQILKTKFETGGETQFNYDINHQINRLRMTRKMSELEVQTIYEVLVGTIETNEQIIEVLSWLPSYLGGLLPLSFGLFHPSKRVRSLSVELIRRFESHQIGQKFFQSLNSFNKLAYQRLAHYQLVSATATVASTPHPHLPSHSASLGPLRTATNDSLSKSSNHHHHPAPPSSSSSSSSVVLSTPTPPTPHASSVCNLPIHPAHPHHHLRSQSSGPESVSEL